VPLVTTPVHKIRRKDIFTPKHLKTIAQIAIVKRVLPHLKEFFKLWENSFQLLQMLFSSRNILNVITINQ
jgi:hypothetical protein